METKVTCILDDLPITIKVEHPPLASCDLLIAKAKHILFRLIGNAAYKATDWTVHQLIEI